MKLSISKLALLIGTPVLLLGYQNCAKLGTDNLIGGSSGFVSSGSTEIASTQSSADAAEEASTPAPQDTAAQKPKLPSVDPMGNSKTLLADAMKACEPSALKMDPNGEYLLESCMNIFCHPDSKTGQWKQQTANLCLGLYRARNS
ncbi:hypothetical protein [Bdellovibrio sp. KM01]|uniref:hypothetical protein n=1 Tax=Bdellovibrio sp. KM01 TaxID=2748865 RepID=UPI0015E91206|nr:hypothetical protein [Bdellovibrio sp. KM01]QLY24843.1 hypothetical protein HW988_15625 [Bdellovibrio sp. KM01]